MDLLKNAANQLQQGQQQNQQQGQQQQSGGSSSGGGFLGGLADKLNSAAGGGRESEKNEDALDKYAYKYPFSAFPPSSLLPQSSRRCKLCADVVLTGALTSCKRSSWVRDHRITRVLLSRRKMSKFRILLERSTKRPLDRFVPLFSIRTPPA
jgi:hypothetical protein